MMLSSLFRIFIVLLILQFICSLQVYKFPKWISRPKDLIFSEKAPHKAYKISNNRKDYLKFADLRNHFKMESENCFRDYIYSVENSLKNYSKYFWKFVNDSEVSSIQCILMMSSQIIFMT